MLVPGACEVDLDEEGAFRGTCCPANRDGTMGKSLHGGYNRSIVYVSVSVRVDSQYILTGDRGDDDASPQTDFWERPNPSESVVRVASRSSSDLTPTLPIVSAPPPSSPHPHWPRTFFRTSHSLETSTPSFLLPLLDIPLCPVSCLAVAGCTEGPATSPSFSIYASRSFPVGFFSHFLPSADSLTRLLQFSCKLQSGSQQHQQITSSLHIETFGPRRFRPSLSLCIIQSHQSTSSFLKSSTSSGLRLLDHNGRSTRTDQRPKSDGTGWPQTPHRPQA
jgi:hypothetical protein